MIIGSLIAIVVVLVIWVISIYNKLVLLQNRVENSWSQIDVVLKNRFDLIPNLIEAVKGYANYERETLDKITQLRTSYQQANSVENKTEINNEMTHALQRIMVISENYPDLKANENFLKLKEELSDIEDKIRFARQFFNDSVELFNTYRMSIPNIFVANAFNFNEKKFFEIADQEKEVVTVKLT